MSLQSDLVFNFSKVDTKTISEQTKKLNDILEEKSQSGPSWWETGAPEYRQMRRDGKTPFPAPVFLDQAKNFSIPSRDSGRDIPCRYIEPKDGKPKAVFVHFHGGGWVLGDHESFDAWINLFTAKLHVISVSVGYRLAPEDPFPAGPEDCFDAVEWLIRNSKEKFGAELQLIGGESAGAHLSVLSILHVRQKIPEFHFSAAILSYGAYDLSMAPSARHFKRPLILNTTAMEKFYEAFCPNTDTEARKNPAISPLHANLKDQELPPAIFLVGTEDGLMDDTLFMSSRWMANGYEALVKLYPGAPHGFITFPADLSDMAKAGQKDIIEYVEGKIR